MLGSIINFNKNLEICTDEGICFIEMSLVSRQRKILSSACSLHLIGDGLWRYCEILSKYFKRGIRKLVPAHCIVSSHDRDDWKFVASRRNVKISWQLAKVCWFNDPKIINCSLPCGISNTISSFSLGPFIINSISGFDAKIRDGIDLARMPF